MILIDTSAFFGIYNNIDPHHAKALKISQYLEESTEKKITTNFLIGETLTILSMRVSKKTAYDFGEMITESTIKTIFIDELYHQKAWEIFQRINAKDVSFADCTSFAVMEALGIKKAFSFDEDFKRYGFETIEV